MKKTLLIGAAIAVGFSGFAQGHRQAANNLNNHSINKANHLVDGERFPISGTKRTGLGANPNAVCTPVHLTTGPNAFGVGGGITTYKQNCLSFNADLNSYVWTHRRSADWAATNTMSSGSVQSTWWNVTTGVKDSSILYYEASATNPARYPTGTFYNPAGNTTWSNVWIVGSGPDLPGGSAFTGPWYSTRQLTGTSADQTNPGTDLYWQNAPNSILGSSLFPNMDMQQVGTRVLVGGDANDTTTSANANNIASFGGIIGKVTNFTATPTWSYDSIIPGYYFNRNGSGNGYATDGEGGRIAFNGNTGYWVGQGRLATNYNNSADSMLSPIVYKTTDGGLTWNGPLLPGYDWSCRHPELSKNVGTIRATKPRHFVLNYHHGVDVTVDNSGKLHLVGTFCDPYLDGKYADSVAFSYTYNHAYQPGSYPIIWDLMTDGTDWKTMMVDSILTSCVGSDPATDTTASFSAVTNGSTFLNYGARVQVSRSVDGSKIFYSWADSDPSVTGTVFNSQPDLFQKGWDLTSNKVTPTYSVTSGLGVCFFHMMADVSYMDGSNNYHVPMVYSLPRNGSGGIYDGLQVTDHMLVDCSTYNVANGDFTTAAVVNNQTAVCAVGIQSHNNFVNSVSNYPNPFSGSTNIVVNLNESKAINVTVCDALGNLVFGKKVNGNVGENTITVDGSALSAGVYYYTVTAGYEKVTKKMIVQK